MLSDRRQRVLAALIEEYVARALPVGSRTLTERYQLGVSPATVRNELSVLEDGGYIAQPHTSAGRIPTDAGYRAFVDNLLVSGLAPDEARYGAVVEELRRSATELDALLERTSAALARLTDCLSIVLAPSVLTLRIKQISLISLSSYRALVVLVTEDGQVFNRQMDFDAEVGPDELARVQKFVGDVFTGKTLQEVESGLGRGMAEAFRDPLVRLVLDEVLSCLQESELGRAHRLGMSSLLDQARIQPCRRAPAGHAGAGGRHGAPARARRRGAARRRAQRAHRQREQGGGAFGRLGGGQPLRARGRGGGGGGHRPDAHGLFEGHPGGPRGERGARRHIGDAARRTPAGPAR